MISVTDLAKTYKNKLIFSEFIKMIVPSEYYINLNDEVFHIHYDSFKSC